MVTPHNVLSKVTYMCLERKRRQLVKIIHHPDERAVRDPHGGRRRRRGLGRIWGGGRGGGRTSKYRFQWAQRWEHSGDRVYYKDRIKARRTAPAAILVRQSPLKRVAFSENPIRRWRYERHFLARGTQKSHRPRHERRRIENDRLKFCARHSDSKDGRDERDGWSDKFHHRRRCRVIV